MRLSVSGSDSVPSRRFVGGTHHDSWPREVDGLTFFLFSFLQEWDLYVLMVWFVLFFRIAVITFL